MTSRRLRSETSTLPLPGSYLPAPNDPVWDEMLVRGEIDIRRVTRTHAAALMQLCDRQRAELPQGTGARPAAGVLELMEALFQPPLRAWAWIAERGGEAAGYAFATVGFSMVERAYYLNLEALFVPASIRPSDVASRLFDAVRRMASDLGCVDLRWQVPVGQSGAPMAMAMPGHTGAATMIQYVFPPLRSDQHD